jgi:hypothetical protein
MSMYPKVHILASASFCWSGMEAQGSQNPRKASPYSPRSFPPKGKLSMEPWGWSSNPHKPWENLHNLIGDSQEISMKTLVLRNLHNLTESSKNITKITKPSRVQRPKRNNLWVQAPERNISRTFTFVYHRRELKLMQQMQWQEPHSQIPPNQQKLLGK